MRVVLRNLKKHSGREAVVVAANDKGKLAVLLDGRMASVKVEHVLIHVPKEAFGGMRVVLRNLKKHSGREAIVVAANDKGRLAVLLDGRMASVKVEHVLIHVPKEAFGDVCAICYDVMLPYTITETMCGHRFHSECIRKWRVGGGADIESSNARCPTCRCYIGIHMSTAISQLTQEFVRDTGIEPPPSFGQDKVDSNPTVVLMEALGGIFQFHSYLTTGRDTSVRDETLFLIDCCTPSPRLAQVREEYLRTIPSAVPSPMQCAVLGSVLASLAQDAELATEFAIMEHYRDANTIDAAKCYKEVERQLFQRVIRRKARSEKDASQWTKAIDRWIDTQRISTSSGL
jgi:hypothetical protein